MNIPILEPGNIWSGSKTLAVFTNPTELAFKKGNLKHHYPIIWMEEKYADVESAYQANKQRSMQDRVELIIILIEIKLKTYPIIMETIRKNGGLDWISHCSHWVGFKRKNFQWWGGDGLTSPFLQCLFKAYNNLILKD